MAPKKPKRDILRPEGLALGTPLPAGPAQTQEGAEGRKSGWTQSGSWFVINGEIRIGKDGLERTKPVDEPVPSCEMLDVYPSDLEGDKLLGKGASGTVVLMRHKRTGKRYAVKVIHFGIILDKQMIEQEIRALEISCPYVVRAYTAFMQDRSLNIVQEYMDLGSLSDVLKRSGTIPEFVLSCIAEQVLSGLQVLHEGLVEGPNQSKVHRIHRDLKPANLLVNSNGEVKIADFGIATTTNTVGKSTFVGTTTYMSPERIKGGRYGTASDVWSVGLLLVECAAGSFPFKKNSNFIELLVDITSTERVALPDHLSEDCKSFLWATMAQDPAQRPAVSQLLKFPFINNHTAWTPAQHSSFPPYSKEVIHASIMTFNRLQHPVVPVPLLIELILPYLSSRIDVLTPIRYWIKQMGLAPKEDEDS